MTDQHGTTFEAPVEINLQGIFDFNIYCNWSQQGVGFGQLALSVKPNSDHVAITGDVECMSKEWVRKALHAAVDTIVDHLPDDRAWDSDGIMVPISEESSNS